MFFVTDSQARMTFLLVAVGGLLFGMLALSRRDMLGVGALILASYLVLLTALHLFAPERVNLQVEAIIVFAYGSVLVIVAYLGSYIAGMRLKLKEQNKKLIELAARDPLTRLPNRRSLMDQLSEEVARADRRSPEQRDLCISMLDVDHFKDVNDTWGHDAGDIVLCKISDVLRESMRQGDFIGRFGGEEFVIILTESTRESAERAAERIRTRIEALQFPGLPPDKRVTVSQGVAIYQQGEKITDTLKRADQALYRAKESGRNKVIMA
jgi:diguanylate cyclase